MTAKQIADRINAAGRKYYQHAARGWDGDSQSRVYFGRDFVTIEASGEIHNRRTGKTCALTIGHSAVAIVEEFAGEVASV